MNPFQVTYSITETRLIISKKIMSQRNNRDAANLKSVEIYIIVISLIGRARYF